MSIENTEYLSKLPKEGLVTLAKRWQSTQTNLGIAIAVWIGGILYMVLNKDALIPDPKQFDAYNQPSLHDFLPAIGAFLGCFTLFMIIVIATMIKTRNTVRELAGEYNVPFRGLLKESKKNQRLLRQYLSS